MRLIKFITIHHNSWNSPLMNFHELVMNRITTYQVHNNSLKFMKLSHNFLWTSYELNWFYQIHKNSWLFMNLSIWTSWTKSWTTLAHQVFINIHYLSWTVLMNSSWTQLMNWLDEPLMNVHEYSWTFINVHHLMSFISGVTGCDISFGFREEFFYRVRAYYTAFRNFVVNLSRPTSSVNTTTYGGFWSGMSSSFYF